VSSGGQRQEPRSRLGLSLVVERSLSLVVELGLSLEQVLVIGWIAQWGALPCYTRSRSQAAKNLHRVLLLGFRVRFSDLLRISELGFRSSGSALLHSFSFISFKLLHRRCGISKAAAWQISCGYFYQSDRSGASRIFKIKKRSRRMMPTAASIGNSGRRC
jgi:hypothetical protein